MEFEQAFLTMITKQILANPLEGETPVSRLKQVGIMTAIGTLHADEMPITLSRLVEMTGLTRSGVAQTIDLLVIRGLLNEEMGKNIMGRGTARQFTVAPALLQNLAIFMGAPLPHATIKADLQ